MVSEGTTVLHEKVSRFHEMAEMACFMYVPCEMAHVCSVRDGVPCEMAHTQNMFHEKWHTWDWTCSMDVPREMAHVCSVRDGVSCEMAHTQNMFHEKAPRCCITRNLFCVCSTRDGTCVFRKRWCFMCVPSFQEGIATHKRDLLFRGWLHRREEMVCQVCALSHGGDGYTHTHNMFHLRAIAHSHVYVWHASFISVTWLVHMCDTASLMHMCMWDMPHSYVWDDTFVRVPWHIHMCDMPHSYVWHDSFICVTWLIHIWNRYFNGTVSDRTLFHLFYLCLTSLVHLCGTPLSSA